MQKRSHFATALRLFKLLAAVMVLGAIAKLALDRRRVSPPPAPSGDASLKPTKIDTSRTAPEPSPEDEDRSPNGHIDLDDVTKQELYERAKDLDIHGRSKMNKEELAEAIEDLEGA